MIAEVECIGIGHMPTEGKDSVQESMLDHENEGQGQLRDLGGCLAWMVMQPSKQGGYQCFEQQDMD